MRSPGQKDARPPPPTCTLRMPLTRPGPSSDLAPVLATFTLHGWSRAPCQCLCQGVGRTRGVSFTPHSKTQGQNNSNAVLSTGRILSTASDFPNNLNAKEDVLYL